MLTLTHSFGHRRRSVVLGLVEKDMVREALPPRESSHLGSSAFEAYACDGP